MMNNYFATSRYVIIDSGFCFLKGLIQLRKKGVFARALINHRRYWPSVVPGKDMEYHFGYMALEVKYAIHETVDDVIYNLWGMTEPNYVMRG